MMAKKKERLESKLAKLARAERARPKAEKRAAKAEAKGKPEV
jgi:hypothetical protein